jgi:hypothetical protein
MAGFRRKIGLGLLLILGLGATDGAPVAAQTDPPAPTACKTTAGDDGLLFQGFYGMVHSPVEFETIRVEDGRLTFYPELRDGLGSLAFGGPVTANEAFVEFLAADGKVVHQCVVKIVAFDPEVHELTRLQAGDCKLKLVAGRQQLMAGHAQVWEFPQKPSERDIAPPLVADISTISNTRLYLLGKSPGVAVLAWTVDEADASQLINLCPIKVASPSEALGDDGPEDKDLCRDASGVQMRLSVGQTATMEFRDGDGQFIEFQEVVTAAPDIAEFSFAADGPGATLRGVAPGSTSITLLNHDATIVQNCEVVVE